MMMALAGEPRSAVRPRARRRDAAADEGEDAGRVQTIGARFAHGEITLEEAAELGCRACASPGGGCQFLGTAATVAGRRRSARACRSAHSALAPVRAADLARHGAPVGPRADGARDARHHDARHPDRRARPQRDGRPRGVRRIDEPASCTSPRSRTPPDCAGQPRDDWARRQSPGARASSTRCRTARAIIRPCRCFWPAACPR